MIVASPEPAEQVVLCAPDGTAVGTAAKASVHHADTPLHLAFSCYLFDRAGQLLVTRRATTKLTWPGVRTNSCCGHPAPGESMHAAVRRRLRTELGIAGASIDLIVPQFHYRAVMADGTVENELCPVYRAIVDDHTITPEPAEVAAAWWVPWSDFLADADGPDALSPWSIHQVAELLRVGAAPVDWPVGDATLLPAAAAP